MEPQKSQPENPTPQSLETTGDSENDTKSTPPAPTVLGSDSGAPTSAPVATPEPLHKRSFFKDMWQRLNLYLLLFLFVIVIAIVVVVVLYVKNRNSTNANTINSQNLSAAALQQLSSANVNVGNSSQVLNVGSSAIFSGSVLMKNALDVAGNLQVGGELQLPSITVSGQSTFSQLQATSLTIGGNASVQGVLTALKGINVAGNSAFSGSVSATQLVTSSLQLNGDLTLTHHITAGGPIPTISKGSALGSGGTASLSGSDTAGTVALNIGGGAGAGCFVTVNFVTAFNSTPHVVISPIGSASAGLSYYVTRTTSSFSICSTTAGPSGQTVDFDYIALD